ncbi:type II toxin-antitoxin system RelE/ParE family toxin [Thauera sp. Sel9]|uniref:type II toxin-antitoxin system RelE/ParE family toxin n=1 Tax=Thauera sp. Sel9 TaxID=2974299 RepID=UPI0021E156D8|nr:type II toxin-antitoxin system RelE/ParE family toxin [Thauera sp. Sel9]MCV2219552.1 type II toxin-antitoxin system RelE/ParE family toxin [Thauera sp. Sel9]
MQIKWTGKAFSDLTRLYEFLAPVDKLAAARTVQALTKAPSTLLTNPRIGEQLFQFDPHEVRRILVGRYEMRYEIQGGTIYILRIWHTREDR